MNIAHNRISAAAGAPDQGASLLRRMAACLSVSLTLGMACAASVQAADERDQQRQEQRYPSQRSERAAQQREDVRQFNPRSFEQRAEERRELQPQRDNAPQDPRRPGRLTQDEKRDLRRQINEAAMDLYPNTPRR